MCAIGYVPAQSCSDSSQPSMGYQRECVRVMWEGGLPTEVVDKVGVGAVSCNDFVVRAQVLNAQVFNVGWLSHIGGTSILASPLRAGGSSRDTPFQGATSASNRSSTCKLETHPLAPIPENY
eukprot:6456579-Amphidinium_carterae.1